MKFIQTWSCCIQNVRDGGRGCNCETNSKQQINVGTERPEKRPDCLICSDSEHAVPAITAAGLLREGHRRVDVLVQRVRVPLAHGVRRGEQLHGTSGHQGDERLLRRGSEGSYRRIQSTKPRFR